MGTEMHVADEDNQKEHNYIAQYFLSTSLTINLSTNISSKFSPQ
jgi:hypothetical protein